MKNKAIIILVITILLSIFSLIFSWFNSSQDIRTRAEESIDFCQDKCIGQDRCGPNGPPGDVNYNDPCCEELAKTGDPGACPWPQRGYCTDAQCATVPEGVSRERCGAPRNVWCNQCRDNKCLGYVDTPVQPTAPPTVFPTKKPTIVPSAVPPQPTKKIIQPTTVLRVIPTNGIRPTINAFPTTTQQNTSFSSFEFPLIQFPKFILPKIQINLIEINQLAKKPMNIVEYIFRRVLYYDRKLENIVNEQLRKIL